MSSEETEIFIHKVKRPFSLLFNRLHKLMNGEDFFFKYSNELNILLLVKSREKQRKAERLKQRNQV